MGHTTTPSVPSELVKMYPPEWLRRNAIDDGAMTRFRCIDIVPLFWCLVMAPVVGSCSSLADMQRLFQAMAGIVVGRSSFLRRFSKGLARFLTTCIRRAVEFQLHEIARISLFKSFKDVLAVDSTVMALSSFLARAFPGSRTNSCPAAAKVNTVFSVVRCSVRSVMIAEGKRAELRFLRIGEWIRDNLLLIDLGYFSYAAFDRIDRHGGFFISRLKASANPTVVSDNIRGPGRRRAIAGCKLLSIVKGLKREVIDVNVKVCFDRKVRGGKTRRFAREFRLVGVFDESSRSHHLYVTNVPIDLMDAEGVAVAYRARWFVEMAFNELKNRYAMGAVSVRKAEVLHCVVLVAVLNMLVSRAILDLLRRRLVVALRASERVEIFAKRIIVRRTPELRFASVFAVFGPLLLPEILRLSGITWSIKLLEGMMALAMIDPNRKREHLLDQLERGAVCS